ncbi:unnamed protein product [Brassica napus]|uniref:(rape) hypothetical protein n=1 Tax=Brassica napus TaxID=3708 RepID=A0A816JSD6_BRANA|nr:unnamed protein product [Brassica napus]
MGVDLIMVDQKSTKQHSLCSGSETLKPSSCTLWQSQPFCIQIRDQFDGLLHEVEEAGRTDGGRGGMKRRRRRQDAQVCQRWRVQQEDGGL